MSQKIIQPTYVAIQPSTGKRINYRPFTVKEEKSLLLALQEDDILTVKEAIKNVISICTDGAIDPTNVPYYDIEYMFLQIRSKSVGEIIDLIGSCECGVDNKTEFSVDIGDVTILPKPSSDNRMSIPDTNYSIEFRHTSIDDIVKTFNSNGEFAEEVVANCILNICTDDEVMNWNFAEKLEFVESMTTKQQAGISRFLESMPIVNLAGSYNCKHCGKHHNVNISGFESFFV